jgi:hypothetical protein
MRATASARESLVLGFFEAVGYRAVPYPPFALERPALLLDFLARARVDHGVVTQGNLIVKPPDNVPFHKAAGVQKVIEAVDATRRYLPAYSERIPAQGREANHRRTEPKHWFVSFERSPVPNVSSTLTMQAINQFDREMLELR